MSNCYLLNHIVQQQATGYKIYGVKIDLANSNPETSVTYTDDAIGMIGGSSAWDSANIFKDIKPCLLKNGVVQYYLNPNDFTKRVDGSASDITSGNDGDVMIEIPKCAFALWNDGTYQYIKITDNPNASIIDSRFHYYAHTRSTEGDRNKLYIGAYLGYTLSSKLRSLSGYLPTVSQTISTFRTQAQANGSGYDQLSFYPLTLLQCLYVIRYKNLNSQIALGRGYVDGNSSAVNTGGTNAKGMYYGETTGQLQMKFCGIEDFWGNLYQWIDGLCSNSTWNILTAFQSFNDNGNGYIDRGQGVTSDIGGYLSAIQGLTTTGFIFKIGNGSTTTYYCDYGRLYASSLPFFGGASSSSASDAGAFRLTIGFSASLYRGDLGSRLMYL